MIPPRPIPTRVVVFIDGQNFYHRCLEHFGWPWLHPLKLARTLVAEDRRRHGSHSHVLSGARFYTGIHDANRRPAGHAKMNRRLKAYRSAGVQTFPIPLLYDDGGRAHEKGVDVRLALDVTRLGRKGLYDVAILVTEDSDLDEAVKDVYALRDEERWIAVENALPWSPSSHTRWLSSARRKRRITREIFGQARDATRY